MTGRRWPLPGGRGRRLLRRGGDRGPVPAGRVRPPVRAATASTRRRSCGAARSRMLLDALRAQGARTEPADAGAPAADAGGARLCRRQPAAARRHLEPVHLGAAHGGAAGARAARRCAVDGLVSRPYVDMTLRDDGAVRRRAPSGTAHERFAVPRAPTRAATTPSSRTPRRRRTSSPRPPSREAASQVLGLHRAGALQGDVALPRRARGDGLHA